MKALQERDQDLQEVYNDLYRRAQAEIISELESYHYRYGNALGLSPEEASLRVSQYDVEAFAEKAKRYVQTRDFSDKANKELKMYNYALRARRDELLKASIELSMLELQANEENLTEQVILKEALAEYERQAGIMGMTVPDVEVMKQTIKALSQTSYQGATWSDRIWQRQGTLQAFVSNIVEDVALRGKSPLESVSSLRKAFDVGAYEARRLAVTESCRVQTGVQKNVLLDNGFEYFVWMPEPTACDYCASMIGKSFKVADMQPGVNAPPGHPHCHCTTVPDADREREKLEEMLEEYKNEKSETIDYMAKKRTFKAKIGKEIYRYSTKAMNSEYSIWSQGKTKAYRDTLSMLEENLSSFDKKDIPNIVIVNRSKFPGIAAYDNSNDVLFVSNELRSKEAVSKVLESGYFASKNMKDILAHELAHKKHWDAAKTLYKQHPKWYNSVEEAKENIDDPVRKYIIGQLQTDVRYLENLSANAASGFAEGQINEVVAEAYVNPHYDQFLSTLLKEALDYDVTD